jgi:hypothetical protein
MESILFLGGLAPAIGRTDGGELGGDGVRTGETGTEVPRGKGNCRGFGGKDIGLGGTQVSLAMVATTVIGGRVVKPGVGKFSKALGQNHDTISRESGVTRISPSNPRPGGENSTITLPKFKVRETPAEGIIVE